MSFLTLEAVSKRYGATVALDCVSLAMERGSRLAIVGPSGSGKTTLLRCIAGSERPDSGRLTLDGRVLVDADGMVPAYRRGIGIVAQDGALFPHLSIAENIGFGLPTRAPGRAERIRDLMAMVGLDLALLERRPDQLSGGQQQRVALARALAPEPRLILLDEPFSALDTALRANTRRAMADLLAAANVTTILVTHDQAEALSFADQVGVMQGGRLLQIGTPRALYAHPCNVAVAEFLGDAIILPAAFAEGRATCALGPVAVDALPDQLPARIMVRPEQVKLAPLHMEARPDDVLAEVIDMEFGGAVCLITVRLVAAEGPLDLTLRCSLHDAPAPGARVRIAVEGKAHILAEPA